MRRKCFPRLSVLNKRLQSTDTASLTHLTVVCFAQGHHRYWGSSLFLLGIWSRGADTIESCSRSSSLLSLLFLSQVYCLLMVSWSWRRYDSQSRASPMNWHGRQEYLTLCLWGGQWRTVKRSDLVRRSDNKEWVVTSPGSTPCCLWDAAPHTCTAGSPTATGSAGLRCTPESTQRGGGGSRCSYMEL